MRGRRTSQSAVSSLDLFLDTICNAFGGIVFTSILLAVLASLRSESTSNAKGRSDSSTALDLQRAEQRVKGLQGERNRLLQSIGDFRKSDYKAEDDEMRSLEKTWADIQSEIAKSTDLQSSGISKLEASVVANQAMKEELDALAKQLKSAEDEERQAKEQYEQASKDHERIVRLPVVRSTSKANELTLMRYGRMYRIYLDAEKNQINDEDLQVTRFFGQVSVEPLQDRGWAIGTQEGQRAVAAWLRARDPSSQCITVGVYADSFGNFEILKRQLIDLGFQYELVPLETSSSVSVGNRDGPAKVQ